MANLPLQTLCLAGQRLVLYLYIYIYLCVFICIYIYMYLFTYSILYAPPFIDVYSTKWKYLLLIQSLET